MLRRLLPLVVLLVLTAPGLVHAAPEDAVTIHVPEARVGDRMRFEHQTPGASAATIVETEASGVARDALGVERLVDWYRVDRIAEGRLFMQTRCAALSGGADAVQGSVLYLEQPEWPQPPDPPQDPLSRILGQTRTSSEATITVQFDWLACEGRSLLAGRALTEGDRLWLSDLIPGVSDWFIDALSQPAAPTQLRGRPALRLDFEMTSLDGSFTQRSRFTFADGLPGPALSEWLSDDGVAHGGTELAGFEAGAGPALAPFTGARLARHNPDARFLAYDPVGFDDGYGLAYRYATALQELVSDPTLPVKSFFEQHPDARLQWAHYRDDESLGDPPGTRAREWTLLFGDNDSMLSAYTRRVAFAAGPTTLAPPATPPFQRTADVRPAQLPVPLGPPVARVATSDEVRRLLDAHDLRLGPITDLSFTSMPDGMGGSMASLWLSDLPCCKDGKEGTVALIDLEAARVSGLGKGRSEVTQTGLLAPPPRVADAPPRLVAASALAAPALAAPVAPVAVAAAGGIAALALALLPLFTRLRRATLLDHPARARLYEVLRAQPGVHLAALVQEAGLSRAATTRHLQRLLRHGFIVAIEQDRFARYYVAGAVPPDVARREAILRAGRLRDVFELHQRAPNLSLREAGARLGMSAPSVHRARRKLEKAGLIGAAR